MGVIENFVRRYRIEFDYYEQTARIAAQLIEDALQSAGIRAIVTFRAKSPSRLEEKVRKRNAARRYRSVNDIYEDIVDLAGVRVALYFPAERLQTARIITGLFVNRGLPKEFPDGSAPPYEKRFSGYGATHFHVYVHKSDLSPSQERFADALVEVQVASVLMHAWAEVEHDLVYKPLQGTLSEDEYAILDELNGLVLAGEIALERLQRAGEARVASRDRKFNNHYDLAAFLLDKASELLRDPAAETAIGRIDLLFALLSELNMTTPEQLEPYIQNLSEDTEKRALSEQIVDQLLAEDASRYAVYERVRANRDLESIGLRGKQVDSSSLESIGRFIMAWSELEALFRQYQVKVAHSHFISPRDIIARIEIGEPSRLEFLRLQRLRNQVVHGRIIPSPSELTEATGSVNELVSIIRNAMEASCLLASRLCMRSL